jgi:hypothetical protein
MKKEFKMNCDYCGTEVAVRGVKDPEYVHRHGGIYCLKNVATVNGHIKPQKTEAQVLAEIAKEWLGNISSTHDAFDKASGWSTESWRIVANGSYTDQSKFRFSNPTEIKSIFGAIVILAKEAGIEL